MRHNTNRRATNPSRKSIRQRLTATPRMLAAAVIVLLIVGLGGVVALAGTMSYTIQYGDTLSELALTHDTDVDSLAELNEIEDPDLIIAGEELLIPVDDESTGPNTYTVQPGDTLASIAIAHEVESAELAALNNLDDPDLIVVGDKLALPASASRDDDAATEQSQAEEAAQDDDQAQSAGVEEDEQEAAEEEAPDTDIEVLSSSPEPVRLHLVKAGETLDAIANSYEVGVKQLVAANALSSSDVSPGMILKIPPAGLSGVQLVGMPAGQEEWPLQSEISAAALATSYWGEPVPTADILAAIPNSPNPHLGFRGDPQGMWGMTDDYGVYHGPLADALQSFGFVADAFYSEGDPGALQARLDAGFPVVVWVTHDLRPQEREVVEDDLGRYSLIPEQHALTVYGYDDGGVYAVEVASGNYVYLPWEPFLASWSLFDGMGLAISVEDAG